MPKNNLTPDDKIKLIEALNKGVEPSPDLLPKLFPGTAEKFDVQALDRAKIPTLEYAGKRSKATILAEAGAGIGAAPLQNVRCFGDIKNGGWRNLIVQGDNLQFLKTCYKNVDPLVKNKIKGKVKLIYIDPPFATKGDFTSGDGAESYSDKINRAEFLENLRERLFFMREILADDGSIYVHCDWRMNSYIKLIMDEVFERDNFLNEIIWCYGERELTQRQFNKKHDNIYFYAKNSGNKDRPFNCWEIALPYSEGSIKKYNLNDNGRLYQIRGKGGPYTGQQQLSPEIEKKFPDWIYRDYFDEKKGILPRDWFADITFENRASLDRTTYPTQKPSKLLERLIRVSSNIDDLVMDLFAGSGTTAAVAEKLGRRWIACDFGKNAIYTMQRRMLRIGESKKLRGNKLVNNDVKRCEECNSVIEENDEYKKCKECGSIYQKEIKDKSEKYGNPPKPFCIISSGAYDFSHVMDLRKHKETYIDFVLGLFQLSRDDDKVKKYKLANIYALKDGDPVEVYPIWDDQFLKEVKIDEGYLRGIIAQSGGRLKGDYFIITPESCANVGDTVVKNPDGKDVNFQMLTFPYKVLEDISRTLELQEQPSSQDNVNNLITSTAFYFNEDVTLKAKRVKGGLQITKFETKILNKEGQRFEGFSGIAMLLVDLDYESKKPFDMDVTVFAKEIGEDGLVKIDNLTKKVGLIAIDKHGNESKPFELD